MNTSLLKKIFILLIGVPTMCNSQTLSTEVPVKLVKHQWQIVQITQTVGDSTPMDMTPFILDCERDNYLKYEPDSSYKLFEGEIKCNQKNGDLIGQGRWYYDNKENSISDRYLGGRSVYKSVLKADDETLTLKYTGENDTTFTYTYYSEVGLKDETKQDIIVDYSEPSGYLTKVIREKLTLTRKYLVIPLSDFYKGVITALDDKNGLLKRVVVMPSVNLKRHTNSTLVEKNNLIALGKKAKIDFVVTSTITSENTQQGSSGKYGTELSYAVEIIEVSTSTTIGSKDFIAKPQREENTDRREKIANGFGEAAKWAGAFGAFGSAPVLNSAPQPLQAVGLSHYVASNVISSRAFSGVFTSANHEEREKHYRTYQSITEAVDKTTPELIRYLKNQMPLMCHVNRMNNGNEIVIEAGSNLEMNVGDQIKIIKLIETKLSDGSTQPETVPLGFAEVKSINGNSFSACKITSGNKQIKEEVGNSISSVYAVLLGKK